LCSPINNSRLDILFEKFFNSYRSHSKSNLEPSRLTCPIWISVFIKCSQDCGLIMMLLRLNTWALHETGICNNVAIQVYAINLLDHVRIWVSGDSNNN
jgi:hypothetical protein